MTKEINLTTKQQCCIGLALQSESKNLWKLGLSLEAQLLETIGKEFADKRNTKIKIVIN